MPGTSGAFDWIPEYISGLMGGGLVVCISIIAKEKYVQQRFRRR